VCSVLVLKKLGEELRSEFLEVITWLSEEEHMQVRTAASCLQFAKSVGGTAWHYALLICAAVRRDWPAAHHNLDDARWVVDI